MSDGTTTLAEPSAPPAVPSTERRFGSLDGLRGVAALVVLFHHSLLLIPLFAEPYYSADQPTNWLTGLVVFSPLHIFWGGTEAVYLFFVLSGFVLTMSTRSVRFNWEAYFPSRLVRLYLPVIGAITFTAILIAIVPRTGGLIGPWINAHTPDYTIARFLQDAFLVTGTSGVVTPLWSLQWEVLFSILLPVFVMVAGRRFPLVTIAVSILLSFLGGRWGVAILVFLPMFAIGVALASNWAWVASIGDRISRWRMGNLVWVVILSVGVLFAIGYWLMYPYSPWAFQSTFDITRPFALVGVTIIVITAALWSPLGRLLTMAPFAWLGRISFSLYLVHEPIVVASSYLWHGSLWAIPCAIVAALIVAVGFYFAIERPSHLLAQRIRRSITARNTANAESVSP